MGLVSTRQNEFLFSKNPLAVLPIASLTAHERVWCDAGLPLDEPITITEAMSYREGSRSRLKIGTSLSRGDMLHLALMSSENRAANALGRSYPGGLRVFVAAMNAKASELGMKDTRYVEPTGLSSRNQSSARDLATLVKIAHEVQIIRELSTSPEYWWSGQPLAPVPQHERAHQEPGVGDRTAETTATSPRPGAAW